MLQRDRRVPPRPSLGIVKFPREEPPKGFHYMSDGKLMKDSDHVLVPKNNIYDPETTNLYKLGGLVEANQMGRPPTYSYMKVKNMGVDQVPTLLQHGEIVIPVKHVDKVAKFLKSQNINLPNMDKLP
jgi:hypothetical protein